MKKSKAMKVTERISKESLYYLRKIVGNYDADPEMDADELIGRICAHITGTFFKINPPEPPPMPAEPLSCLNDERFRRDAIGPKPPRQKRFKSYAQYMASKEWRIRRQEAITTHLDRCDVCGAKESLRVSHRHFNTLYKETPQDLDVLCPDCHDNKYEGKHATVYDPITAEYLSRMADA